MNSYWSRDVGDGSNLEPIREDLEDQLEEDKVISKAEKRFDDLSKLFTFIPSFNSAIPVHGKINRKNLAALKTEYNQLRNLLEERAYLKIATFYQTSLHHLHQLLQEIEKIMSEQHELLANYQAGYIVSLKPQNTYFDEFASTVATLKMHTTHWIQWKQMILTNRWYYCKLDRYLGEHLRNLHTFYQLCLRICNILHSLIDNAIFVLCRVADEAWLDDSIEEYGRDFFSTFDHLNGVQNHMKELRKSITRPSRQKKINFDDWTCETLFDKLSLQDGVYLARRIADDFHAQLTCVDQIWEKSPPEKVPEQHGLAEEWLHFGEEYLVVNRCRRTKDTKPVEVNLAQVLNATNVLSVQTDIQKEKPSALETSDYFSSSASSSNKTFPEVEKPGLPKKAATVDDARKQSHEILVLNKKVKRSLQSFYTGFLERRYTTFNYLLEEGAKHKTLHERSCSDTGEVSGSASGKKTVKWLDDTLMKNKKQIWKAYVKTLWNSFLQEWQWILTNGCKEYSSIRVLEPATAMRTATLVLEALIMVQLPKEMSPCDHLIRHIRECVCCVILDKVLPLPLEFAGLLHSLASSKSSVTIFGQRLEFISDMAGGLECANWLNSLGKFALWKSINDAIAHLSSFDLIHGYSLIITYLRYLRDEKTKLFMQQLLDKLLQSKVRATTKETLDVAFPSKKYWRLHGQGEPNDEYLQVLQASVCDPIMDACKSLDKSKRMQFLVMALEEMMQSWLSWLKGKEYRFSRSGAIRLRMTFEATRNYVRSMDFLSPDEQEAVSNIASFLQALSIADVLAGNSKAVSAQFKSAGRRWRNFKVSPNNVQEEQDTSQTKDAVVRVETDLLQWSKYRSRSLVPNCFCFS